MIPKIINYCYFGDEETMPEDFKNCLDSWHRHLSDYTFVKWDRSCYDLMPKYARDALDAGNYAVASDWVRIYSLYLNGGLYFDCDVLVNHPLPTYLFDTTAFFVGRGVKNEVCGEILGAEWHNPIFRYILEWFETAQFIPNNIYLAPTIFGNLLSLFFDTVIRADKGERAFIKKLKNNETTVVIYPEKLLNDKEGYLYHLGKATWTNEYITFMKTIPEFKQ